MLSFTQLDVPLAGPLNRVFQILAIREGDIVSAKATSARRNSVFMPSPVHGPSNNTSQSCDMQFAVRILVRSRACRLALQNDHKLLTLAPLAFEPVRVLSFDLLIRFYLLLRF